MPGVITERNRRTIGRANASLRAEYQVLRPQYRLRVPAHPRILCQTEKITAGPRAQDFVRQRKRTLRTRRAGLDIEFRGLAEQVREIGFRFVHLGHSHELRLRFASSIFP